MRLQCRPWLLGTLAVLVAFWLLASPSAAQQAVPSPAAPSAAAPGQAFAPAAPQAKIDSGDTAWMLTSAALVLMMTAPGLALFYGGMVRRQNVLGTIMHSFVIMALISIQWVLWGTAWPLDPTWVDWSATFLGWD